MLIALLQLSATVDWAVQAGGPGDDLKLRTIVPDRSGGALVVGDFYKHASFGTT